MKIYKEFFEDNQKWAAESKASDPDFFPSLQSDSIRAFFISGAVIAVFLQKK